MTAEPNRPRKRAKHHADSPAAFRGKRGALRGSRLGIEHLESRCLLSVAPAPQLVDDINNISTGGGAFARAVVGSTLFYTAYDGFHGYELWKIDGTSSGGQLVADINPGPANSRPRELINVEGTLYFTANDGIHGYQLWKSDGTCSGTQMIAEVNHGTAHNNLYGATYFDLTNVNGELFFSVNDGVHGYELWKSDGTSSGTQMVADIDAGSASGAVGDLINVGGTLFFAGTDGTHGLGLWKSDGTKSAHKWSATSISEDARKSHQHRRDALLYRQRWSTRLRTLESRWDKLRHSDGVRTESCD